MFSSVLDCPACAHRFQYEHQTEDFPEEITCPECGRSSAREDYSALLFCPHCRSKLKVPLDILHEINLMCPRCNGVLNDNSVSLNEEDYESTYDGSDRPESFQRLLQDGAIFDKFRVIRLLGRGGMAEVYQAEHLLLKQQCALKLMRNNGATCDPVFIKRFLREAKLSHSLNHPNIVKVYDVGNDAKTGYFFIAMEYIEGKTLLELSRQEQLSEETLKAVLFSMGNALQVLADARVVHRDIKPSNIMLDSNGVFKLMDLGIAKSASNHAAGEMTLTMEQSTMGTPSYASPEQCQSAHSVDIRSDIYSLGATIYHAASGKLPFAGSTAVEIILKVVQGEAEPLKNLRPDLSPGFLELVSQMMEKDPANRPESPEKFVSMLLHTHEVKKTGGKRWFAVFSRRKVQAGKEKSSGKSILWGIKALVILVLLGLMVFNGYVFYQKFIAAESPDGILDATSEDEYRTEKLPMAGYPEAPGVIRPVYRLINWQRQSVSQKVRLVPMDDEYAVAECDFLQNVSEKFFPPAIVRDGMAHLDENVDRLVHITPRVGTNWKNGCTLVLGLQVPARDADCRVVEWYAGTSKCTFYIRKRSLVVTLGEQYALLDCTIPAGKWVNLTLSIDVRKQKLIVLADDVILGSFLLDKRQSYFSGSFIFPTRDNSGFGYKLCYAKLYNQPFDLHFPSPAEMAALPFYDNPQDVRKTWIPVLNKSSSAEKQSSAAVIAPVAAATKKPEPAAPVVAEVTTPVAVASAAAAVPERKSPVPTIFDNPDMSLDEQLEFCRKRYQAFEEKYGKSTENASTKGARTEILQYRKQLLKEWQARLNYLEDRNKKIAAAKTQKYDDAAGRAFQAGFRDLTAANRPFENDHIAHSRALSQMLRQKNIDPNLPVEDISRNPRRGPLICVLASAMIVQSPAFLPPLLDRYVDPMPLGHADSRRSYYFLQHPRLIAYGLPACVLPRTLSVILETKNLSYNIAMLKLLTPSCKTIFFDGHDFSGSDLIAAVLHEREDLVMLMLAAGADPDWRDANGETALFATYLSPKGARFRELLLAAGANPEIRNVSGKTHQDFASVGDFIQRWEKNDLVSCRKMLSMKQVSPDMIMANGYTLLTDACRKMNVPAIKMLTQCGALPDARDRRGWTPMDELFMHLQQYKNTRRSSGRQTAVRTSSGAAVGKVNCENVYEAIRLLLTAGADLSRKPVNDSDNYLLSFLARYSDLPGWSEMVVFMLKYTKNFDVTHWRSVAEVVRYHQMIPPYVKNQIYAAMPRELRTERANNGR